MPPYLVAAQLPKHATSNIHLIYWFLYFVDPTLTYGKWHILLIPPKLSLLLGDITSVIIEMEGGQDQPCRKMGLCNPGYHKIVTSLHIVP